MASIVKFSVNDLNALISDETSCIFKKTVIRNVTLQPWCLSNLKNALNKYLTEKIGKFDQELDGIVVSYKNVKIIQELAIKQESGDIRSDVRLDLYYFRPQVGSRLKGVVNKRGASHTGALVHGIFNAVLPRPSHRLQLGKAVTFMVETLDLQSPLPYIRGSLSESMPSPEADENDAESEADLPAPHVNFDGTKPKITKDIAAIPKKSAQQESSESSSDEDETLLLYYYLRNNKEATRKKILQKPARPSVPKSDGSESDDEQSDPATTPATRKKRKKSIDTLVTPNVSMSFNMENKILHGKAFSHSTPKEPADKAKKPNYLKTALKASLNLPEPSKEAKSPSKSVRFLYKEITTSDSDNDEMDSSTKITLTQNAHSKTDKNKEKTSSKKGGGSSSSPDGKKTKLSKKNKQETKISSSVKKNDVPTKIVGKASPTKPNKVSHKQPVASSTDDEITSPSLNTSKIMKNLTESGDSTAVNKAMKSPLADKKMHVKVAASSPRNKNKPVDSSSTSSSSDESSPQRLTLIQLLLAQKFDTTFSPSKKNTETSKKNVFTPSPRDVKTSSSRKDIVSDLVAKKMESLSPARSSCRKSPATNRVSPGRVKSMSARMKQLKSPTASIVSPSLASVKNKSSNDSKDSSALSQKRVESFEHIVSSHSESKLKSKSFMESDERKETNKNSDLTDIKRNESETLAAISGGDDKKRNKRLQKNSESTSAQSRTKINTTIFPEGISPLKCNKYGIALRTPEKRKITEFKSPKLCDFSPVDWNPVNKKNLDKNQKSSIKQHPKDDTSYLIKKPNSNSIGELSETQPLNNTNLPVLKTPENKKSEKSKVSKDEFLSKISLSPRQFKSEMKNESTEKTKEPPSDEIELKIKKKDKKKKSRDENKFEVNKSPVGKGDEKNQSTHDITSPSHVSNHSDIAIGKKSKKKEASYYAEDTISKIFDHEDSMPVKEADKKHKGNDESNASVDQVDSKKKKKKSKHKEKHESVSDVSNGMAEKSVSPSQELISDKTVASKKRKRKHSGDPSLTQDKMQPSLHTPDEMSPPVKRQKKHRGVTERQEESIPCKPNKSQEVTLNSAEDVLAYLKEDPSLIQQIQNLINRKRKSCDS